MFDSTIIHEAGTYILLIKGPTIVANISSLERVAVERILVA